jgi:phosphoglycolate phosphatase-like HAD superfamily hydrolase
MEIHKMSEFKIKHYKNVIWDFDGVILDSNEIRKKGFRFIFKDFKEDKVKLLLQYHFENGGLSRYVKIRHFYENILGRSITESQVNKHAEDFSRIMLEHLADKALVISDSYYFIKKYYKDYNFHIASGSDENELRILCKKLELSKYFLSIKGSPTPKINLVREIIRNNSYRINETCLIGDSVNDYEAATHSGISFIGYNNRSLTSYGTYVTSFS